MPFQVQDLVEMGEEALKDGMHRVAIQHFEEALNLDPDDFRANMGLSRTLIAIGDLGAAEACLKKMSGMPSLFAMPLLQEIKSKRGVDDGGQLAEASGWSGWRTMMTGCVILVLVIKVLMWFGSGSESGHHVHADVRPALTGPIVPPLRKHEPERRQIGQVADRPAQPRRSAVVQQHQVIANANSKIYHSPSCSYVSKMNPSNRRSMSASEAGSMGYRPCKRCGGG